MRNRKQLFVLAIFLNSLIYSQHSDVENIYLNSTSLTTINLVSKKTTGSVYILDRFINAQISNQKTTYLMRYNAYLDKMEVELDNKAYYLPISSNYSINFGSLNKTYQVLDSKDDEINNKGFFVVLFTGDKISLFLKEKIKLYEEVPAKLGFTKYEPPALKRKKDKFYFTSKNNMNVIELPKKKKDFFKLFLDKDQLIKQYSNENKLSFKEREDLIQIFKFYNTLQ